MRPALLWKALPDRAGAAAPSTRRVQCRLCSHFCIVAEGKSGLCGVRRNHEGTLYTLVADKVAALNLDPIEKKPLYHFHPGSLTLSLATMGCNFTCSFCQNFELSQTPRQGAPIQGRTETPETLVERAIQLGAPSISYTYTEPTIFFELMLPTAQLATKHGLKNIIVSNGYQSPACLDALGPYIHAANIDLKAFRDDFYRKHCGAKLGPVLRNLKHIKKLGWWLEVTTLLIPGLNDSEAELNDLAGFIKDELDPQTPWHVSRFHPTYQMHDRGPTEIDSLERAWAIGRAVGLDYVYVGNVAGHQGDNTYCPQCGHVVIERRGFHLFKMHPACPACGAALAGVGLDGPRNGGTH